MSKRNIILIVIFTIGLVVMMIAGNIIIVAQRIAQACNFPAMEYIIYGVIILLFAYIFLLPLFRIHMAPQLPAMALSPEEDISRMRALGKALAANMAYIPDADIRRARKRQYSTDLAMAANNEHVLRQVIEKELANRFEGNEALGTVGINKRITDWATSTFIVTAVSQNGRFDSLSVILLNIRMISDIVRASGFRPTRRQLFRLYVNVLTTALMTYILSGALAETGDVAPFSFLGDDAETEAAADMADSEEGFSITGILNNIKIPGFIIGSAIDGAANALMTFRIGYITRTYLTDGVAAFRGSAARRQIKRRAMRQAVKCLPTVLANASSVIGSGTANLIKRMFKA